MIASSCCSVLPTPPGNDRAAERQRAQLQDEAAGRQMIGEGIVHDVAGAEAGGIKRARRTPPILALPFRLEDRPRRHQQALHLARWRGVEAAERRELLLQRRNVGFVQYRQLGERGARCHRFRIDAGKMLGPTWRVHRARNDLRQRGELLALALSRIAGFQCVVVIGHCRPTPASACAGDNACLRGNDLRLPSETPR